MKKISVFVLALVMILTSVPPSFNVQAAEVVPLMASAVTVPIYQDESYSYEERAADMVSRMTVAEKASQTAGYNSSAIPRLGISSYMWWNEALHGYSQEGWFGITTDGASYPSSYSMGASWDPDLYYQEAVEIGAEIRERVKGNKYNLTMFSPTVNLARDPRWGRNDESYGEDSFLVGKMGAAFVKGVEGKDENGNYRLTNSNNEGIKQAVTTIKHYAANNSEKNRYTSGADNVSVREMREYYTRPSRIVVGDADVSSVMMAYSSVDGIPISFSSYYMDTILRQIYGFSGYIVSDCDSINTSYNRNIHKTNPHTGQPYTLGEAYANAMANGLDLQCNAGETDGLGSYASNYKRMIKDAEGNPIVTDKGYFTEQQLESTVHRLMTKRMQLGEFDSENSYVTEGAARLAAGQAGDYLNGAAGQTQDRIELADELSRATVALLKNEENALPITADEINDAADKYQVGIIGPVGQSNFRGGYSSRLSNEANIVTIEQAINAAFSDEDTYNQATRDNLDIAYHYGFSSAVSRSSFTRLNSAEIDLSEVEDNLDLAIVVVGQGSGDSREDGDRTDLSLSQAQVDLITQVKAKNPKKLIIVMETYGPVNMVDDIVDNADAILWSSFNGFRKGVGFGESITGKNNPSGHTNATWLKDMITDTPEFFDYGLFPVDGKGGRTYMYNVEKTIYPFGHGLSYADVEYAPAAAGGSILGATAADSLVLGTSSNPITKDSVIDVNFKITNTNATAGKQVAQVYVVSPGAGTNPEIPQKRLVGFDKVQIDADGSETVTIPVKVTDFAFYNEETECYELPTGEWTIWVARSSAFGENDLSESFTVENGDIREDPQVVTVKPTQQGDGESNGVSERVIFGLSNDPSKNVVSPNVAVTMANEKLYGTRVINNVPGKDIGVDPDAVNEATAATDDKWAVPDSAADVERLDAGKTADQLPKIGTKLTLPETYNVTYASNRPAVVQVGNETSANTFADGQIVMKAPGVATITVKVTAPSGEESTTDFVVCVQGETVLTEITLGDNPIDDFDPRTLNYSCNIPNDMDITSDTLQVKATAVPGITVEYSTTDDGSGTIGYEADPSGKGVKPSVLPGSVYIKISGSGIADLVYRVQFDEEMSATSFINGTIDDNWTIINEDNSLYEAVRGYGLKLPTLPDNISASDTYKNLFLRPAAGDWTIVTKIYFPIRPTQSTQQVRLMAWQDPINHISVGLQSGFSWFGPAGLTMAMAPTIGGASNGSISCSTGLDATEDPLVIYYKLQREGLKFTAWFSTDGINYTQVQSADGRRSSESSLLKDVQLGLFATKAGQQSPTIDTYCEFLDVTSRNGEVLKMDQEVLDDAFQDVMDYLGEEIPSEVSSDIQLPIPFDYIVTYEADACINPDGTLNLPEEDQKVDVKIKISHPLAKIDGKSEVTVFDGKIEVKASGTETEYGVSKDSMNMQKGQTESFYLTLGSKAVRATLKVDDEGIATVNTGSVLKNQGITVSAKAKGNTDITITWYDENDAKLGSKTISVAVKDSQQQPSYGVSKNSLNIKKGGTDTFDVTMDKDTVMSASVSVADPSIATVNPKELSEGKTITVSALKKGETRITVTWFGLPNNTELDSITIPLTVTETNKTRTSPIDTLSYTITAEQSEGGNISPTTTSIMLGESQTFDIKANEGYAIADVLVDGESVGVVSAYTFKDVQANHTITATFTKTETDDVVDFIDVKSGDWYAKAVQYVQEKGLMEGTSATIFSPQAATTRGMIATILYRQAGSPVVESDKATWYSDARVWAMNEGVSDGTNMDGFITREQLVTMLNRYAKLKGINVAQAGELDGFPDAEKISSYAVEAMRWSITNGIIIGKNGSVLDPQAGATRAETATMLMRFCEMLAK